jgi:hypothetical protein
MKLLTKLLIIGLVFGTMLHARPAASSDAKAGYNDGCRSARGHYTRSAYKYKHSGAYHKGWLRGKRACKRRKTLKRDRKRHTSKRYRSCNTEVPWEAFRRGWEHGNLSARGRFRVDRNGCAAYRQGWVSGYRDCHCNDLKKPDSYAEGYYAGCVSAPQLTIRDDHYHRTQAGYREGWKQGYKDCRAMYR